MGALINIKKRGNNMLQANVKPETKYYFICPNCQQKNAAIQSGGYKLAVERCLKCNKEIKLNW